MGPGAVPSPPTAYIARGSVMPFMYPMYASTIGIGDDVPSEPSDCMIPIPGDPRGSAGNGAQNTSCELQRRGQTSDWACGVCASR